MSKIAIISQPEQGVLLDVSGCQSVEEATQHLTSTLNVSSQFWDGLTVDLNLGTLNLAGHEVEQILSTASGMGVEFDKVFTEDEKTVAWLSQRNIKAAQGKPTFINEETEEDKTIVEEGYETDVVAFAGPGSENANSENAENAENAEGKEKAPATKSGAKGKKTKKGAAANNGPAVMFLRQTLRSGQTVSHKGHLVIVGDVNPGAEVVADGDITIWGALRGVAHAGVNGNVDAQIRALKLRPMQLRIAHAIARAPDRPYNPNIGYAGPETARIVNGQIRIAVNLPE